MWHVLWATKSKNVLWKTGVKSVCVYCYVSNTTSKTSSLNSQQLWIYWCSPFLKPIQHIIKTEDAMPSALMWVSYCQEQQKMSVTDTVSLPPLHQDLNVSLYIPPLQLQVSFYSSNTSTWTAGHKKKAEYELVAGGAMQQYLQTLTTSSMAVFIASSGASAVAVSTTACCVQSKSPHGSQRRAQTRKLVVVIHVNQRHP